VTGTLTADVTVERIDLSEGSWIDVVRGFVDEPVPVFRTLRDDVAWKGSRLWRYEQWVDEPRVGAGFRVGAYPHPVLTDTHRWLQHRYPARFGAVALAHYRDGRDGQAFHRDRDLRHCEDTIIAILTFGARRPWLVRPRTRADKWIAEDGGATVDLAPAGGDLLVMGGRCQVDCEHSVPQLRHRPDAARISAQWRWTSGRGRPEVGGSYRAPRNFSR
jgi:alkylated DNA repair dioxygenase AlkB